MRGSAWIYKLTAGAEILTMLQQGPLLIDILTDTLTDTLTDILTDVSTDILTESYYIATGAPEARHGGKRLDLQGGGLY